MSALRLGVCAYPVTAPTDFDEWTRKIDALLGEGRAGGGEFLLLPEYACMELAAGLPGAGDAAEELRQVTARADAILDAFRDAAMRHGVWLAAGTIPFRDGSITRNRAPLISPAGRVVFQDKAVMTRFEAESWGVASGTAPRVFETPWGRIGVAICYDSEFPDIVRAEAEAGAWLVLVPSCTDTRHGDMRIRIAARARAMELQCFTAVAATVGEAPGLATLDRNFGRAAVYGPVDRGFAEDGVVAEGGLDAPGWIFAELDPARLAAVREEGAVRNWRDRPIRRPECTVEGGLASGGQGSALDPLGP